MDPAVKALEARQDEIMRKLYELKAAVEGLAKTVTTPDADLDLTVSSSLSSQSSTAFKATTDLDALLGKVIVSSCIWQDVVLAFLAFMATLGCRLIIVPAVLMQYFCHLSVTRISALSVISS